MHLYAHITYTKSNMNCFVSLAPVKYTTLVSVNIMIIVSIIYVVKYITSND